MSTHNYYDINFVWKQLICFMCRYVYDNVDESIPIHDQDGDGMIGIEEYLKSSYGEVEGNCTYTVIFHTM